VSAVQDSEGVEFMAKARRLRRLSCATTAWHGRRLAWWQLWISR